MCMFSRSLFILLSFSFDHCVVCPLIFGLWLPPLVFSNSFHFIMHIMYMISIWLYLQNFVQEENLFYNWNQWPMRACKSIHHQGFNTNFDIPLMKSTNNKQKNVHLTISQTRVGLTMSNLFLFNRCFVVTISSTQTVITYAVKICILFSDVESDQYCNFIC